MYRLLGLLFMIAAASEAAALDVCPAYAKIHKGVIVERIRSGIPFKLLSIAASEHGSYRRVVRLEYDLWEEELTVESLGRTTTNCKMTGSMLEICKALSFPEAPAGQRYQYRLFLNPVLGEGLARFGKGTSTSSGFLKVNWRRLAKDLDTEETLIDTEFAP